jgi:hypothetical protein
VTAVGGISVEIAVRVGLKIVASLDVGLVNHQKCPTLHVVHVVHVLAGVLISFVMELYIVYLTMLKNIVD